MITFTRNAENEVWSAVIYVGTNAKENDDLFHTVKQTDLWFHLANLSSAHVYLSINGIPSKSEFGKLMYECGNIVKQHSKCNNNAKVCYIERKYLSKDKKTKTGQVILKKRPMHI